MAVAIVAAVILLGGRGDNWVIYNISPDQARNLVSQSLQGLAVGFTAEANGFRLENGKNCGKISLRYFSLLRNVSIRLEGVDVVFSQRFISMMGQKLMSHKTQANPMAVSMLLVATGMLVAPLAMMAPQVPEIVRALTNLLP